MTDATPEKQSPLFAAHLTPHRAMSGKGVRWVIAFTAVLASIPAITFYAMGAWPVAGLLGLDVGLLWWAMSASLKSGEAFEDITLWPDALDIRRVSAKGRETKISFNPFYVRFSVVRDTDNRVTALNLQSRDARTEIGRFLTPGDKDKFAQAFADALYRTRR
jgi:uncharacterized membrane protein